MSLLRLAVCLAGGLLALLHLASARLEFDEEGNLISDGLSLLLKNRAPTEIAAAPVPDAVSEGRAEKQPEEDTKKVLHIIHHPPLNSFDTKTTPTPKIGLIRYENNKPVGSILPDGWRHLLAKASEPHGLKKENEVAMAKIPGTGHTIRIEKGSQETLGQAELQEAFQQLHEASHGGDKGSSQPVWGQENITSLPTQQLPHTGVVKETSGQKPSHEAPETRDQIIVHSVGAQNGSKSVDKKEGKTPKMIKIEFPQNINDSIAETLLEQQLAATRSESPAPALKIEQQPHTIPDAGNGNAPPLKDQKSLTIDDVFIESLDDNKKDEMNQTNTEDVSNKESTDIEHEDETKAENTTIVVRNDTVSSVLTAADDDDEISVSAKTKEGVPQGNTALSSSDEVDMAKAIKQLVNSATSDKLRSSSSQLEKDTNAKSEPWQQTQSIALNKDISDKFLLQGLDKVNPPPESPHGNAPPLKDQKSLTKVNPTPESPHGNAPPLKDPKSLTKDDVSIESLDNNQKDEMNQTNTEDVSNKESNDIKHEDETKAENTTIVVPNDSGTKQLLSEMSKAMLEHLQHLHGREAIKGDLFLYPWENGVCEDHLPANIPGTFTCDTFKPMCEFFPVKAYKYCRKTCRLCARDHPPPLVIGATLSHGLVFMSQQNVLAPTFMTACLLKDFVKDNNLVANPPDLKIHTYGDVSDGCKHFGHVFKPSRAKKEAGQTGDLGGLVFGDVPDNWPESALTCPGDNKTIGAYGMLENLQLFGTDSPCLRPIALYDSKPANDTTAPLDCGKLSSGLKTSVGTEVKFKLFPDKSSANKVNEVAKSELEDATVSDKRNGVEKVKEISKDPEEQQGEMGESEKVTVDSAETDEKKTNATVSSVEDDSSSPNPENRPIEEDESDLVIEGHQDSTHTEGVPDNNSPLNPEKQPTSSEQPWGTAADTSPAEDEKKNPEGEGGSEEVPFVITSTEALVPENTNTSTSPADAKEDLNAVKKDEPQALANVDDNLAESQEQSDNQKTPFFNAVKEDEPQALANVDDNLAESQEQSDNQKTPFFNAIKEDEPEALANVDDNLVESQEQSDNEKRPVSNAVKEEDPTFSTNADNKQVDEPQKQSDGQEIPVSIAVKEDEPQALENEDDNLVESREQSDNENRPVSNAVKEDEPQPLANVDKLVDEPQKQSDDQEVPVSNAIKEQEPKSLINADNKPVESQEQMGDKTVPVADAVKEEDPTSLTNLDDKQVGEPQKQSNDQKVPVSNAVKDEEPKSSTNSDDKQVMPLEKSEDQTSPVSNAVKEEEYQLDPKNSQEQSGNQQLPVANAVQEETSSQEQNWPAGNAGNSFEFPSADAVKEEPQSPVKKNNKLVQPKFGFGNGRWVFVEDGENVEALKEKFRVR